MGVINICKDFCDFLLLNADLPLLKPGLGYFELMSSLHCSSNFGFTGWSPVWILERYHLHTSLYKLHTENIIMMFHNEIIFINGKKYNDIS